MSQSLFQTLSRAVLDRIGQPPPRRYAHLQEDGICPERIAKPGHIPSANGCGAEDGGKFPDKIWGANFSYACTLHDYCYDTCNTSQTTCDSNFCDDLNGACAVPGIAHYLLTNCTAIAGVYCGAVTFFGEDAYNAAQANACICCEPGETACGEPEKDRCCAADETCCDGQCCPPGQQCCDGVCKDSCDAGQLVYCACNDQCYEDVQVCLDECKVGLGCFTGICGPAEPGQCG